jgi:hypothetical protein
MGDAVFFLCIIDLNHLCAIMIKVNRIVSPYSPRFVKWLIVCLLCMLVL